jgi:flagellar biogenesis protein FliO
VTTIVVWAIAAALVAAGVAILRARRTRSGGAETIRLVTSRYLGAKRFLTIVEVDGERLLLGLAGEHVSLVARLGGAHADEHAREEHP